MELIPYFIIWLYGIIFVLLIIAIIYVIVKRVRDAKNENFEKRDY